MEYDDPTQEKAPWSAALPAIGRRAAGSIEAHLSAPRCAGPGATRGQLDQAPPVSATASCGAGGAGGDKKRRACARGSQSQEENPRFSRVRDAQPIRCAAVHG